MLTHYTASIDQSTTATKVSIFLKDGSLKYSAIEHHTQITPHSQWLEHDPMEIMRCLHKAINSVRDAMKSDGITDLSCILGVGLCNQRETIVAWDSVTGEPLCNAIVWCDNRTQQIADEFKKKHNQSELKKKTGLPISSYFSLFKILWLIQNVEAVKQKVKTGQVRFGTIDSWVCYKLTGNFVTDASNASRTFLYNLSGHWDQDLISMTGIQQEWLPKVVDSFANIGTIKEGGFQGLAINCILGDQQSSAFALNLAPSQAKNSYGSGCFMMMNIGTDRKIFKEFVTTILFKDKDHIQYALEASIQCGAGTINWARRLGLFNQYTELNALDQSSGGVLFYPSFGSIYSPFWKNKTTGAFVGLSQHSTRVHMLRAILDSIAYRVHDNMLSEEFPKIKAYKVDGGVTSNPILMQLQADLLGQDVTVCALDTTWGVAKGVMRGQGVEVPAEAKKELKVYHPDQRTQEEALKRYRVWSQNRQRSEEWQS